MVGEPNQAEAQSFRATGRSVAEFKKLFRIMKPGFEKPETHLQGNEIGLLPAKTSKFRKQKAIIFVKLQYGIKVDWYEINNLYLKK